MAEVDGEDVIRELFDLLDDEAFAALRPADDILELVILHQARNTSRIS